MKPEPANAVPDATPDRKRRDLATLVGDHTVLRGESHAAARLGLLLELERHVDPEETVLAYADRSFHPPDLLPLDSLLATERQLMRLVMLPGGDSAGANGSGAGGTAGTRSYRFHRLHVPERFLHQLGLEIFLSQDETFWRWKLIPAVPDIHVRLPSALRLYGEEEWWNWEPPPKEERNDRIRQLHSRAVMWRRAHSLYRQNGGG